MIVLIVEDDPVIAMDLADTFSQHGCEVAAHVETVERAREVLSALHVDLIILDLHLADGTFGPDLLNDDLTRTISVVLLTGAPESLNDHTASRFPVIQKPFQQSDIAKIVAALT